MGEVVQNEEIRKSTMPRKKIITHVGRGKLGGMTSSSLLKLRILLGAKSGYSGHMQASGRSNKVSRLSCIKHRENGISLSRRNGSHNGIIGNKEVCELFQSQT